MTLQEKLDLWVRIAGVNPSEDKKKYTLCFDGRISDYDIRKMNDRIKETLEDDETGMFAEAYLSVYLNQFLEKKNIPLLEIITNKELPDFIDDVKTLYNGLEETNAKEVILSEAKKAMDFYKLPCNLDTISIIEIRTSAMRCMNGGLNLLQFSAGENKANDFKFSKDIYMFDNLDALIVCSAKGNLNGVTLGYIRDKENLANSFFSFIIKNGDNLYLLTDMPKYSHPVQKDMSRCPGRDMSKRIESNFFPYETVANIDTSDLWGHGRYGVSETKAALSTVINEDTPYTVIGTIENLNEAEAFWFIMMVSLIKKKFYENELPSLPLNYTRSMITSSLLEKNTNALVVQSKLPSFELKEVDIKDTYTLEYEVKNKKYAGVNDYLVNRYADKIDNSILNVIANTDKSKLLEDMYEKKNSWGQKTGCEIKFLNLDTTAGTKEEIEYNQMWIARYNYATAINKEIKKDYMEKCNSLYKTIGEYITPRLDILIEMHLKNELLEYDTHRNGFDISLSEKKISIGDTVEFNKWYNTNMSSGTYKYGIPNYGNKADIKCYFTNTSAGVVIRINPQTAEGLALVCGISVEELPEELQHYNKKSHRYIGNSILNNVDPFLSVIDDTFNEMVFSITVILSKRKYLEFCNKAGVEAVKFWENEKPVCHETYRECKGKYRNIWDGKHINIELAKKCQKCKWYKGNENT